MATLSSQLYDIHAVLLCCVLFIFFLDSQGKNTSIPWGCSTDNSGYHHRSTTAQDFVGVMSGVPLALDGNAKGTPLIIPTESWAVVLLWLPLPVIWIWRIWLKAFGMNILFIKLFCILQRKMLKRMLLLSTRSTCTKFVYRSGICFVFKWQCTLLWRHNGHSSVSNHQPHDCLHNRLFRRRSK